MLYSAASRRGLINIHGRGQASRASRSTHRRADGLAESDPEAKSRNIRIDFRWAAADEEAMQTVRAGTRRAAARPHSIQIKSRLTISFSIGFVDKLASKLRHLGADVHTSAVICRISTRGRKRFEKAWQISSNSQT